MVARDDGAWGLGDGEFEAALAFDQEGRFNYFVHRVARQGALWVLIRPEGRDGREELITAGEDEEYVPVWPHPEFAAAVAEFETFLHDCEPVRIDLDDWNANWGSFFAETNRSVYVFPRASDGSGMVSNFEALALSLETLRHRAAPLSDAEVAELIALNQGQQYVWFLETVAASRELWILMDDADDSVATYDYEGVEFVAIWPHQRIAELAAAGPWATYTPASISLDDWDGYWAPGYAERGAEALVWPDANGRGPHFTMSELQADITEYRNELLEDDTGR